MPESRYRTLIICSHPVQYMSPLLRRMAQHSQIDLQVAYCSLRGAQTVYDPDFATAVQWDVPLLDGYKWVRFQTLVRAPNRFSAFAIPDSGDSFGGAALTRSSATPAT